MSETLFLLSTVQVPIEEFLYLESRCASCIHKETVLNAVTQIYC